MNGDSTPNRVRYGSQKSQPSVGCLGGANSVVELLESHLMETARERSIRQAVAGGRFCAVVLDDGGAGVANLCPDVCGTPSRGAVGVLPRPGTSATEALEALTLRDHSAIGLATANALANRFRTLGMQADGAVFPGDLLRVLKLKPDDHVGMVGCFSPIVEPVRHRVRQLSIFERGQRQASGLLDEDQAYGLLPECSVALITATTLLNGTIDALLIAAASCREVVLLGPSTPLTPDVFASSPGRVTLLAGAVVTDAEQILRTVARGGGTRDFGSGAAKVNVRVSRIGKGLLPG